MPKRVIRGEHKLLGVRNKGNRYKKISSINSNTYRPENLSPEKYSTVLAISNSQRTGRDNNDLFETRSPSFKRKRMNEVSTSKNEEHAHIRRSYK